MGNATLLDDGSPEVVFDESAIIENGDFTGEFEEEEGFVFGRVVDQFDLIPPPINEDTEDAIPEADEAFSLPLPLLDDLRVVENETEETKDNPPHHLTAPPPDHFDVSLVPTLAQFLERVGRLTGRSNEIMSILEDADAKCAAEHPLGSVLHPVLESLRNESESPPVEKMVMKKKTILADSAATS